MLIDPTCTVGDATSAEQASICRLRITSNGAHEDLLMRLRYGTIHVGIATVSSAASCSDVQNNTTSHLGDGTWLGPKVGRRCGLPAGGGGGGRRAHGAAVLQIAGTFDALSRLSTTRGSCLLEMPFPATLRAKDITALRQPYASVALVFTICAAPAKAHCMKRTSALYAIRCSDTRGELRLTSIHGLRRRVRGVSGLHLPGVVLREAAVVTTSATKVRC